MNSRKISEISSATRWRMSVVQQNRCQKSSSRENRRRSRFHGYSLHRKRCDPTLAHDTMTLEKTLEERDTPDQAVVRTVNGTARAVSIQYEIREIISPASSSRQWGCRLKPSDANVRISCRVEETSRAKNVWPEENKIAMVLSSSHQFKIPEHILNRKRRCHETK